MILHLLSGNLSHQIEHHLFPDLPSNRYAQIAPRVRALCERFGLPYNTGPLIRQTANVWKNIIRLALPGQKATTRRRGVVEAGVRIHRRLTLRPEAPRTRHRGEVYRT
jgi:linoleoyl-CoA desaturase